MRDLYALDTRESPPLIFWVWHGTVRSGAVFRRTCYKFSVHPEVRNMYANTVIFSGFRT